MMYYHGDGVEQNNAEALEMFQRDLAREWS